MKNVMIISLIKYNVIYLGSLLFALVFLGAIAHRGRLESGSGWSWSHPYLDSYVIAGLFLLILIISLISYIYAFWNTWQLSSSNQISNKLGILTFGWLVGAPIIVVSEGMLIITGMRLVTDTLFF